MKKWAGSLTVILISLITPFLVWLLLYSLAHLKVQSFDPNPMVQSLVSNPRSINKKDSLTRWAHLVGKDGVWSIKEKGGALLPLEKLTFGSERTVLLLEAQGPTLAMSLFHFLKDKNVLDKVILLSNSDGLIKDLRFHDPRMTMSCGQAFVIRFHALQRLSIEGLLTIDMSAVWLDPNVFGESLKELTDFFAARKVAVFIGPYANLPGNELEKKANILID